MFGIVLVLIGGIVDILYHEILPKRIQEVGLKHVFFRSEQLSLRIYLYIYHVYKYTTYVIEWKDLYA